MLFSSPIFFLFFLVYLALHQVVPLRHRIYLVIAGSTIFYAWWRLEYVWLPYALMAVAYGGVLWMARAGTARSRKVRAAVTIVVLLLPLLVFKYADFIYRDVLGPALGWQGALVSLALPLGISFITFTLIAFIVDVYTGKFPRVPSATTVLGYVLFFPHLIAGPILRPSEIVSQLEQPRRTWLRRAAAPIALITLGLVKKLVVADVIAEAVDDIYLQDALSAPSAALAIYGFSVQIYCDFSGYTDMAIGLALMLGVRLPNNFARPYTATSIVDFWRRWHITLSSWLRDYLYIPLGGSRHGRIKEYRNVIITMVIGGLWHGANWTFVAWGFLHGLGVAATHALQRASGSVRAMPGWIAGLVTFHFVTLAWVLFRSPTMAKAGQMLGALFSGEGWRTAPALVSTMPFVLAVMVLFAIGHPFDDHRRLKLLARRTRPEIFWPAMAFCWILAITVSQGSSAKFIYFDF